VPAMMALGELIGEMGGVDMIVISSAVGLINQGLDWEMESRQIEVNVRGFAAMANVAYKHFEKKGGGCLVGISSFACLRGKADMESYSASKAFVSTYLEGLRMKAAKRGLDIKVVDVRPGFVDTPMSRGQKGMFWVAGAEKAARQIVDAAEKGRSIAYITRRWRILAHLVKNLPDFIYRRV